MTLLGFVKKSLRPVNIYEKENSIKDLQAGFITVADVAIFLTSALEKKLIKSV